MNLHYDVIVVGAGVVGCAAALALAKNTPLKIALIESKQISFDWKKDEMDFRVSSIALASQKFFHDLNVWELMQSKRVSEFTRMTVWDANSAGEIQFDCKEIRQNKLGFIIEDSVMRLSLLEKIRESSIDILSPLKLFSVHAKENEVELVTEEQKKLSAKLIIAADGANSWVREQMQIESRIQDYQQTAIVTTVTTELSHQQTAWQRFLPKGPLAFLPLQDEKTSSIVWSAENEYAAELLAMNDETFQLALADAFENKLGKIISIQKRYHFPLSYRHAKNYVKQKVVLIGDAAHTIHPLAGQGVNLGLQDAMMLTNIMAENFKKHRDFSSFSALRKYERARKSDNFVMLTAVDFIKKLFCNHHTMIQNARGVGLNVTNRLSFLKKFFSEHATGKS